jgi:hypothetical protein
MPVISNKQQIKQAFPGATIGSITELFSRGKINISNIDIVIIHVGTNNTNNKLKRI